MFDFLQVITIVVNNLQKIIKKRDYVKAGNSSLKLRLNWQKDNPAKTQKDQSPKKRQEILDDWNVKILPSKKKQIQIQRRNTDPRIYYRSETTIAINSKENLTT